MVKKNNKNLIIGISVVAVLIVIGIFLFYPTAENNNPITSEDKAKSTTAYFSRDNSGNYVPSAGITAETPTQSATELTQPAQSSAQDESPYPPSAEITSVQPKGYLSDLKISATTFTIGTPIVLTGKFHAESPGDYYIEVGLDKSSKQPLALLESSQSACDESRNYAGVWYRGGKAGDVIDFKLSISEYGETGKYKVVGGVYSRCGTGSDIASITPIQVSITSSQPQITATEPTNSNTNPPASSTPATCTPSGYFTQLWVRKSGLKYNSGFSNDNAIPRVVGVFKNNAPCRVEYYIEAGMLESSFKPLAFIPSISGASGTPSACDGNVHFSGVKVTLNPGESTGFKLYPQNFGRDGRFTLQGGVYNKNGQFCGFGANVAGFREQEIVFAGFGTTDIANSWERVIP